MSFRNPMVVVFFKMMNLPISHDVLTLHPMEENSEKKILLL